MLREDHQPQSIAIVALGDSATAALTRSDRRAQADADAPASPEVELMLRSDHLRLTEAGNGAWRVSDTRVPEDGASHIVASIDAHNQDFEVLWIRGAIVAPGIFHSLASALDAIDGVVTAST